jgi:hypothetical protein
LKAAVWRLSFFGVVMSRAIVVFYGQAFAAVFR